MHEGKPIIGNTGRVVSIWLAAIIVFSAVLPYGAFAAQQAGGKTAPSASAEATPPKIHELLTLLADQGVQKWLEQQGSEAKTAAGSSQETANSSVSHYFDARIGAIRDHIVALAAALPDLDPYRFLEPGRRRAASAFNGARRGVF